MRLPITTHILQAFVTEPVKPFLDVIIVSAQMHVYVSQTDRGEFLIGAEIEPYTTYKSIGTLLVPGVLGAPRARALPAARAAQGAALVDGALRPLARLQPDPRQDRARQLPPLRRLGDVRVQGGADRRTTLAELVATGRTPDLIAPFALERFHTDTLVSELAAAAVSHYA